MANSRFFTNTYTTGSGRQNYLRIDNLEDPLFTSFTFDIDFISSPLFYTINNKDYGYPNSVGLAKNIETALKEMYEQMAGKDQGYDILPLLSANFLDGDKLGFGLQQNIYADLPLYGATEYIYMVDKRNGDGSQNDVRYDNNTFAENGGNQSAYNSYKLGDSVKEVVSESDKKWAEEQRKQADIVIGECDKILNNNDIKNTHESNKEKVKTAKDSYENYKVSVDGKEYSEADLLNVVNEFTKKENSFKQLKQDIANWVNGELSAFQTNITSIYNKNKCVKKIMEYENIDDSNKDNIGRELEDKFGNDFRDEYIWNYSEKNDLFLSKCLELYNNLETYERSPDREYYKKSSENVESLLIEKTAGNGEVTVRQSKVESKFGEKIKAIFGENFTTYNIQVSQSKDAPDWTGDLGRRLQQFRDQGVEALTEEIVVKPMEYLCEKDGSFEDFDKEFEEKIESGYEKYIEALDDIRSELYGETSNGVCDASNPEPDSRYSNYMEAKDVYENDEYSQAEKTKAIAKSGLGYAGITTPNNGQNVSNGNPKGTVSTSLQSADVTPNEPNFVSQTVLDMLGFISGMKKMITEYPYVINSITGLDKAYENHYGIKDPYMGSGDNKITLTCWESLDLRVSSMFNRYFNAVYDRQYRRERVPINLRRFNCLIYVHDVRNFVSKRRDNYDNRILELTDMYYSAIEFRFYDCEIVPGETGNIFNDISNEAPTEMKKTNFTFTYGNCVVNFVPQSEIAAH
jgi:hypothetical protein